MLLFAASCLVDLARPCWFSQSGGVPHEDGQGEEACSLLLENTAPGLPLESDRKNTLQ